MRWIRWTRARAAEFRRVLLLGYDLVILPAARTGLRVDSKALAEELRSVAVERVGARIRLVPYALLSQLEEAIRIHLDLG